MVYSHIVGGIFNHVYNSMSVYLRLPVLISTQQPTMGKWGCIMAPWTLYSRWRLLLGWWRWSRKVAVWWASGWRQVVGSVGRSAPPSIQRRTPKCKHMLVWYSKREERFTCFRITANFYSQGRSEAGDRPASFSVHVARPLWLGAVLPHSTLPSWWMKMWQMWLLIYLLCVVSYDYLIVHYYHIYLSA